MRRREGREVITLLGGAAAVWPLAAWPQQNGRVRRLAFFRVASENDPVEQAQLKVFRDALRKLGWIEGCNLRIDFRYIDDDPERRRAAAAELVGLGRM
jgi:hypothetical protein